MNVLTYIILIALRQTHTIYIKFACIYNYMVNRVVSSIVCFAYAHAGFLLV